MRISDWSSDVCSSDLGARFAAGNVAYRDRIIYRNARLTLTSIVPGGPSAIISDTNFIGEDPFVTRFWERVYGINVQPYPSTETRLAGLSPIASDAHAIMEAFEARGSALKIAANVDDVSPTWLQSPPTDRKRRVEGKSVSIRVEV